MRIASVVAVVGTAVIVVTTACTGPLPIVPSVPSSDDDVYDEDGLTDATGQPPIPGDPSTSIPSKIRYVIVLVKENHTFDNYFTGFPGAESATTAQRSDGSMLSRPKAPNTVLPQDLCHANTCGQRAYAGGAMNGFDKNHGGDLPFIRYDESQIPNYWRYARNFVLADHMFSTTLGPSSPGHEVFWAGRSLSIDNAKCHKDGGVGCTGKGCRADADTTITTYDPDTCSTKTVRPCFDVPSLPDHLPAGFTWSDYGGPMAYIVKSIADAPDAPAHFYKAGDLVKHLEDGRIGNLTIAHLSSGAGSEHPPQFPCNGENLTVDIVNAAMKLPQWKEMAIVVTWDDWGGFYDHVAPTVRACPNGKVLQTGFRLPLIIISPYAKKGFVLKTPAEQASVPRLIEDLWGMEYMTARDPRAGDGRAGSLMSAFDFEQSPRDPLLLDRRTCPAP